MSQEQEELRRLRAAARALVDALQKCDQCEKPATHGATRWPQACWEHADSVPAPRTFPAPEVKLPLHDPLRALLALLGDA